MYGLLMFAIIVTLIMIYALGRKIHNHGHRITAGEMRQADFEEFTARERDKIRKLAERAVISNNAYAAVIEDSPSLRVRHLDQARHKRRA